MRRKALLRRWSGAALIAMLALPARTADAQDGPCAGNTSFQIGSGIHDITGPAAERGMMGYGKIFEQPTAGIHQRLRARAFVIASPCNGKRIAFVSADLGMVFQGVKQQVMERLKSLYKDRYTDANTVLSATHTHSGPGGYSHYALYNLTIEGFDKQNFDAIVDGIVQSIILADKHLVPGTVRINSGELAGASINRSPPSYGMNPEDERARWHPHDVDRTMTLLRLQAADGTEVGTINWFAVHPTSMGNDNLLISGDNKGYASYLFEKAKGTDYLSKDRTFVAAFAQSNEGDVSSNIHGGTNGGGANDFESTDSSGTKQYTMARSLYDNATQQLTGGVDYRHSYVKMDGVGITPAYGMGLKRTTCPASIGIAMLGGADDGPGVIKQQGWTCEKFTAQFGVLVAARFSCTPVKNACQEEKPIVLNMLEAGMALGGVPWTPEVLPLQIVTVGNLAIVAVPFEVTTMAGRRLRQTVLSQLAPARPTRQHAMRVVIAGLANAYAGYVTTREEYSNQEYEGASTHFGPWTLAAVQQEMERIAIALREGTPVAPGPTPRDLRNQQKIVHAPVPFDDKPPGVKFGDVALNANGLYTRNQTVIVKFWSGHPKNNYRRQGSFLQVQRKEGDQWKTVAHDWDWETRFRWERIKCFPTLACSQATVEWDIPANAKPGLYRIRHDGDWKAALSGAISSYTGYSREFNVQ